MNRGRRDAGAAVGAVASVLLACLILWPHPAARPPAVPGPGHLAETPSTRLAVASRAAVALPRRDGDRGAVREAVAVHVPDASRGLHGRIVDAVTGEPVTAFRVSWQPLAPARRAGRATADPHTTLDRNDLRGRFAIPDLVPGSYALRVMPSRLLFEPAVVRVTVPAAEPLTVAVDRGGHVAGRILDGHARPVAGVEVALAGRRCRTDAEGCYDFSTVAAGRHVLRVLDGTSASVVVPERGLVERDLRLPFGGTLDVEVADQEGAPIAGVRVRLLGHGGDHREAVTTPEGAVRFLGWAPGRYEVLVMPRRGRPAARSLELATCTDRSLRITVGPRG